MTDHPAITALVADDEDGPRLRLAMALRAAWPNARVVEAVNGTDAWDAVLEHSPAVCFLDVRMPGLTGIDVAQRIDGTARVVFVAAPSDPALQALEAADVDVLRKPVDAEAIAKLVARLVIALGHPPPDPRALLDRLASQMRRPAPLEVVRTGMGRDTVAVRTDDVVYFETEGRHTRVVAVDGEGMIRTPVKDLVGQLDGASFVQIDRHVLVNRRFIERLDDDVPDSLRVALVGRPERLSVAGRFRPRLQADPLR